MTGLTPHYERKLTPLKSLAEATARVSAVAPFTSRLLFKGQFTEVVENLRLLSQKTLHKITI